MNEGFIASAEPGFSLFGFIWRYKFWIALILFTLPAVISSIVVAINTSDPTLPFFQLAERIFTADNVINQDVNLLINNPSALVGMAYPETGIWKHFVFGWLFFWNVIWKIFSEIWLIFLPLLIMIKLINLGDTTSPAKNLIKAIVYFLLYLFIANSVIAIHDLAVGKITININPGENIFTEYLQTTLVLLPFHGVVNLLVYIVNLFIH